MIKKLCYVCLGSKRESGLTAVWLKRDPPGGSRLSWIFWEHEILSSLSVIWFIYIKFYKEKEKKSGKKSGLSGNLA